jgi:hypothetical protein
MPRSGAVLRLGHIGSSLARELSSVQLRVNTAGGEQVRMRAPLDDVPVDNDQDLVSVAHG